MFGLGKNNAGIDACAIELVTVFAQRFPPAKQALLGGTKLKPAQDLARAANQLEQSVAKFSRDEKLGIYGKARLLNQIKWQMKELGYTAEFVEASTTELAKLLGAQE